MSVRPVKNVRETKDTIEGAGVRLRRAFGFGDTTDFDPFLLFDDFRNENPDDYLAGFPWHPHRGIETITYVLAGNVEHGDSLGNRGTLGAGDVQWMTAGSGIMHQEMPQGDAQGRMHGFQLWANLPASLKMTRPGIRTSARPTSPRSPTTTGRTCGWCAASSGANGDRSRASPPIRGISTSRCRRESANAGSRDSRHAFAYVFEGSGTFRDASDPRPVRNEIGPSDAATDRWCSSTAATKSACRPAIRASGSCSFQASRSRSRWPGTADRDEHQGGAAAGDLRPAGRNVHQVRRAQARSRPA